MKLDSLSIYLTTAFLVIVLGACAQKQDRVALLAQQVPECSPALLSEANGLLAESNMPIRFSSEPLTVDIYRLWFWDDATASLVRSCIAPPVTTRNGVGFPLVNEGLTGSSPGFFIVTVPKDDPRVAELRRQTSSEQAFRAQALQFIYRIYGGNNEGFRRVEPAGVVNVDGRSASITGV
jgi:hypothetical protein